MTPNPYRPPTAEPSTSQRSVETTRIRRGPALYIIGFGLLGGFGSIPILTLNRRNDVVLVGLLVGCIVGGIAYRVRSRNWPHDRTIPQRQLLYSAVGLAIGAGIGALVGFVGGASYLAVVATIGGERFDGMGLILFGIFGSPVGLVLGAPFGAIVASRSRR